SGPRWRITACIANSRVTSCVDGRGSTMTLMPHMGFIIASVVIVGECASSGRRNIGFYCLVDLVGDDFASGRQQVTGIERDLRAITAGQVMDVIVDDGVDLRCGFGDGELEVGGE